MPVRCTHEPQYVHVFQQGIPCWDERRPHSEDSISSSVPVFDRRSNGGAARYIMAPCVGGRASNRAALSLEHCFAAPYIKGTRTTASVAVTALTASEGPTKEHSHGHRHSQMVQR